MPILIDEKSCLEGCTICDFFCPGDIIYREDRDRPAVVKYPEECWYCGGCEIVCPTDAVTVLFPPEMLHCSTDDEVFLGARPG